MPPSTSVQPEHPLFLALAMQSPTCVFHFRLHKRVEAVFRLNFRCVPARRRSIALGPCAIPPDIIVLMYCQGPCRGSSGHRVSAGHRVCVGRDISCALVLARLPGAHTALPRSMPPRADSTEDHHSCNLGPNRWQHCTCKGAGHGIGVGTPLRNAWL